MKLLFLLVSILVGLGSSFAFAQEPSVQEKARSQATEYLIFQIAELPPIGNAHASWAIFRPPLLWVQNEVFDLNSVKWPQWNLVQIPVAISSATGMVAKIRIFNDKKEWVEDQILQKSFSTEEYSRTKLFFNGY